MSAAGKVALGVAAGYLLGRRRKLKLAITIGSMLAGKRIATSPQGLLKQGQELIESNEELTRLSEQVRSQLFEAARSAAVATASSRMNSLSDTIRDRSAGLSGKDEDADEAEDTEQDEETPPEDMEEGSEDDGEVDDVDDEADEAGESDETDETDEAEDEEGEDEAPAEPSPPKPTRKSSGSGTKKKSAPAKKSSSTRKKSPAKKSPAKKSSARSGSSGKG